MSKDNLINRAYSIIDDLLDTMNCMPICVEEFIGDELNTKIQEWKEDVNGSDM